MRATRCLMALAHIAAALLFFLPSSTHGQSQIAPNPNPAGNTITIDVVDGNFNVLNPFQNFGEIDNLDGAVFSNTGLVFNEGLYLTLNGAQTLNRPGGSFVNQNGGAFQSGGVFGNGGGIIVNRS